MMKKKNCIKCFGEKKLTDFYKSSVHTSGYTNICKECIRSLRILAYLIKMEDPIYVESERKRARQKYAKVSSKARPKSTYSSANKDRRYRKSNPEKKKAHDAVWRSGLKSKNGQFHHWSYNQIHWLDVIDLTKREHSLIHRYILYDSKLQLYRKSECNTILSTRSEHEEWIKQVIERERTLADGT